MSLAPFDLWPDQLVDGASGLRAWFVPPRFVVMQFPGPVFTELGARASVQAVDDVIVALGAQLRANGGLVMMNDVRACTTVERGAQVVIQAAWKRLDPRDLAEAWVFKGDLSFLASTVLGMVNRVAAFATGKTQRVVAAPDEVLARYRLGPPPPDVRFPTAPHLTAAVRR